MGYMAHSVCILAVSVSGLFGSKTKDIEGRWYQALAKREQTLEELQSECGYAVPIEMLLRLHSKIVVTADAVENISAYSEKDYMDISKKTLTYCLDGKRFTFPPGCVTSRYKVVERSDNRWVLELEYEWPNGKPYESLKTIELIAADVIKYDQTLFIRNTSGLEAAQLP